MKTNIIIWNMKIIIKKTSHLQKICVGLEYHKNINEKNTKKCIGDKIFLYKLHLELVSFSFIIHKEHFISINK